MNGIIIGNGSGLKKPIGSDMGAYIDPLPPSKGEAPQSGSTVVPRVCVFFLGEKERECCSLARVLPLVNEGGVVMGCSRLRN